MKRFIIILSMLTLFAACSREDVGSGSVQNGESRPMRMLAMTMSEGIEPMASGPDDTPVFLFWIDSDNAQLGNTEVVPYFVSYPKGVTDDYKEDPYNTEHPYPGTKNVYAHGYNPSCLIADESRLPWTSFIVPEDRLGDLDITSTTGFEVGSQSSPFEADANKTLRFNHMQSRVNFYARLGEIPAERYFRAVKISVNGNGRFTSRVAWDTETLKYQAVEKLAEDRWWNAQDPDSNQMDPNEIDARKIGSVYLHPGEGEIVFDLELQMSETVTFDSYETISFKNATVRFEDGGGYIDLAAGDEYDIEITILYDSFVIKGNKALWQDGGKIPLPFYPN